MKARGIRDLTISEIEGQTKFSKKELFNLCFQLTTGQLEETARIHTIRKTIARLETVARKRETEQNKVNQ